MRGGCCARSLGLALVLALIFAVGWVMRRIAPTRRAAAARCAWSARRRSARASASCCWKSASNGSWSASRRQTCAAWRRCRAASCRCRPRRRRPHSTRFLRARAASRAAAAVMRALRIRALRRAAAVAAALAPARSRSKATSRCSTACRPGDGGQSYSLPVQTLLFLSALAFLPAILLLMTAFTRIVIVMSLLRHALGTQASPPNQVIIGPVAVPHAVRDGAGRRPHLRRRVRAVHAAEARRDAGLRQGAGSAQGVHAEADARARPRAVPAPVAPARAATRADVPLRVLVPAFVTSELKTAFQIGFMVFIPFVIIDMVVASVLMSMGMMMLSPVLISLPFKLMLFVLVDGWNLLIGSLVASFG
jgi:flagellar biosynthetic protein FliP